MSNISSHFYQFSWFWMVIIFLWLKIVEGDREDGIFTQEFLLYLFPKPTICSHIFLSLLPTCSIVSKRNCFCWVSFASRSRWPSISFIFWIALWGKPSFHSFWTQLICKYQTLSCCLENKPQMGNENGCIVDQVVSIFFLAVKFSWIEIWILVWYPGAPLPLLGKYVATKT